MSCNKKVRWAETVVENKLRPTYNTPPLPAYHKQKRVTFQDPKAEELYYFLKVHEPSRMHESEAIVRRYRQDGRIEYLMCDMKASYGCCSRRCRLCASGAMDEDALLLELSKCGPVTECGTFGENYSGEDLEALLVMCGGRDSLSSTFDGCIEAEAPYPHHSSNLSRDSSLSSAGSLSSASSSPVLHEQKPENYNNFFVGLEGRQGDPSCDGLSPPLLQFRRREGTKNCCPAVEFRKRDCRAESDPFDDIDFGDFHMH